MVTKIEIKDWNTKKVLFSYKCEDNTIKKTVEEAVRRGINLAYANLSHADLRCAKLRWAKLRCVRLNDADLSGAKLCNANLNEAVLCNANLSSAFLNNAVLIKANLEKANLEKATLVHTDLKYADLVDADLIGANLSFAILTDSNLFNAKIDYPMNLPQGEFIAWKKLDCPENKKTYIIKLKILADSKRSRATSDKCRCDKALVMEIQNLNGSKTNLTKVVNCNYARCVYKVGEIVYADSWDEDRWKECSHGIHFFLDWINAVMY